jgi:hypothetical protein
MKQKQKCTGCGRDYFTSMLKVYVFKRHTCPDDKTELVKAIDQEAFGCPKCARVFRKSVPAEWNSMGTRIEGSTRSFEEKAKRLAEQPNLSAENIMIPDKAMCQNCTNYQMRAAQATRNRERKIEMGVPDDIKAIPDSVSDADIYRYEVFRKTQTDYQETQKAIAYEKQKQERAVMEVERQKKLAEQMQRPILPTREEMKPLLDPETVKIGEEIKVKDTHIAELQKQKEAAEKLKKDMRKTDAKIAKLKKKLEEAKEEDAKAKGAAKVLNGE